MIKRTYVKLLAVVTLLEFLLLRARRRHTRKRTLDLSRGHFCVKVQNVFDFRIRKFVNQGDIETIHGHEAFGGDVHSLKLLHVRLPSSHGSCLHPTKAGQEL